MFFPIELFRLGKMEKHPLKGNASIPMNVPASYQAVGNKVGSSACPIY